MDGATAAKMVSEVEDWARLEEADAVVNGDGEGAEVWRDLAEAASDLEHMIRHLTDHLPADA